MEYNPTIGINYFSEFICESIKAFMIADDLIEQANEILPDRDLEKFDLSSYAGYHARYSFLTAASALEAAANALIAGMVESRSLYDDVEKLGTLLKYELFCISNKKTLDRGNILYAKIQDVVKCRNEFVHPKPKHVCLRSNENDEIEITVTKTKTSNYPLYVSLLEPLHVRNAISDILGFIAWVVFDICDYGLKKGSLLIGNNTVSISGDVMLAGQRYGFDLRSFGESRT